MIYRYMLLITWHTTAKKIVDGITNNTLSIIAVIISVTFVKPVHVSGINPGQTGSLRRSSTKMLYH